MMNSKIFFAPIVMLLLATQPVLVAKQDEAKALTPIELQSRLMSFADELMIEIASASLEFNLQGYAKTPLSRAAVEGRKLHASASAISIAAGRNPEVALLDMVVLVSLLKYSMEDYSNPNFIGKEAEMFLPVYANLEQKIWVIADDVLNDAQEKELKSLIDEWKLANQGKLKAAAAYVRFTEFGEKRHDSSIFSQGKPKGFLKKVGDATQEIEQTRILAERAIFLLERQPTLVRWQIEQVYFDLALTNEFQDVLVNTRDIPISAREVAQGLNRVSGSLDSVLDIVNAQTEAALEQAVKQLSAASGEAVDNYIDSLLIKIFFLAMSIILGFMLLLLGYRYLSLKMQPRLVAGD